MKKVIIDTKEIELVIEENELYTKVIENSKKLLNVINELENVLNENDYLNNVLNVLGLELVKSYQAEKGSNVYVEKTSGGVTGMGASYLINFTFGHIESDEEIELTMKVTDHNKFSANINFNEWYTKNDILETLENNLIDELSNLIDEL